MCPGGLDCAGPALEINRSTIDGNSGFTVGGGVAISGADGNFAGTVRITDSTISGNVGAFVGGGIICEGTGCSTIEITNSTCSGNTSFAGSCFAAQTSDNLDIYFASSTITNNTSNYFLNGAIYIQPLTSDPIIEVFLDHTIVALNNGGPDCSIGGPPGGGAITSLDYNIDSDNSCVLTQANDLPSQGVGALLLGALADNGGPTETHALDGASVAVDGGFTSCVEANSGPALTADQRGEPRPVDGDGVNLAECDIGAFEFKEPYVLQHSKCYKLDKKGSSKDFDPVQVTLQDQFDAEPVLTKVKKPTSFCNPVNKNGEGIIDETLHMTCYDIDAVDKQSASVKRTVFVDNQFGNAQQLNLLDSNQLCLPSEKDNVVADLERMDHFKCYKIDREKGKNAPTFPGFPIVVTLEDQFDTEGPVDYVVEKPTGFCNPVDKNGEGVIEPEGVLACYKVKLEEKAPFELVTVESDNQLFSDQVLRLTEPNSLCVPSIETE